MSSNLTLEKALTFTKLSTGLVGIWRESKQSRLEQTFLNFLWHFCVFCASTLAVCLAVTLVVNSNDPEILSKSMCLMLACSQVLMKISVCRIHRNRLRFLIDEMRRFLKRATDDEKKYIELYVRRSKPLHFFLLVCCYGAGSVVLCGPLVLSGAVLPSDAIYPFSVKSGLGWLLGYAHHIFAAYQVSAGMCIDSLGALILWYTGMRFELLDNKFRRVNNTNNLFDCIREHQELLGYGRQACKAFRFIVFSTVISSTPAIAFSGIYVFSPVSLFVKAQFVIVSIAAGFNLYVLAWPADNLIVMCREISDACWFSPWFNRRAKYMKNFVSIVQRSHKPVVIHVPVLIPELSLAYYFLVLKSTFSYFTALHVMMGEK